ncbi:hypothetical protein AUC68_06070 [Methyloceanibacter methanicus]|uniref:Uncharacterized protein n=1 Tax=Methyloceanibacter methanicus TaxID=1774968 RepID=A0A1E3VZ39_9HYPH|nr:hypothetical protein AUC68_06070 [Methyloceanibacter methanicus]
MAPPRAATNYVSNENWEDFLLRRRNIFWIQCGDAAPNRSFAFAIAFFDIDGLPPAESWAPLDPSVD